MGVEAPRFLTERLAPLARAHAERLAPLAGARLFVTGATGFFGTWLLHAVALVNAQGLGLRVDAASRDPARFLGRFPSLAQAAWLGWQSLDVRDLARATPIAGTTHVLHMAASSDARDYASDALGMSDTLISGARGAIGFSRASRAHLHYVSSGAIYGARRASAGGARESDDQTGAPALHDRLAAYGNAKRAAEALVAQGLDDWCVSRPFAFLGPLLPLDQHFAAGNFVRDAAAGEPIVIRGDGTPLRSFLHPADLAFSLLELLAHPARGRAVNLGSDTALSIAQLAERIDALAGGAGVRILGTPDPRADPPAYWPDISHARALGLAPTVSLDDAIRDTLAWARATVGATATPLA